MLKRILETKDAIISTLALINAPVDALCQEEWELVKEVCTILQPFEELCLGLKMVLLCKGLQQVTAQQTVTMQKVKELVANLCSAMDWKFLRIEYNTVLSETTLLDPRFKKTWIHDNRAVDEALQRVSATAAKCTSSSQPAPPLEGQVDEEPQTSVVWRLFDERATGEATRRNPTADAIMEVRSYLEEPIIQRSEDSMRWWQAKASVFPHLVKVMEGRLRIVATSVPSERIFSKNRTDTHREKK
ncbi:hypothetical protein Q8A73_008113 [Channa argus]|nr:hypothetical protein Q8A73_008113 [Channa argus]